MAKKQPKTRYFRVKDERRDYLGTRYFKTDFTSEQVVQICVSVGDVKKGKGNNVGVYTINQMTFFCNYLGREYAKECSKREFDKHFIKMVTSLNQHSL